MFLETFIIITLLKAFVEYAATKTLINVARHEIFGPNDVIWTQDHKTEIGDQTQISRI
jgi:hypothetical protein